MRLSEIGEHALTQFPDRTLEVKKIFGCSPTLYDAKGNSININVKVLRKKEPEEQCAVLCHETFHYFHATHDKNSYIRRRQTPSGFYKWQDYEEELTITGKVNGKDFKDGGVNHSLFNENAVLKDRDLPPRSNYGGSDVQQVKKPVAMTFDF